MTRFRFLVGAAVAVVALGFLVWLEVSVPPRAQRFVVDNQYADALCQVEYQNRPSEEVSVRKGETFEALYKAPREGFVDVRCSGEGWQLDSPGHFRFIDGGLAKIILTPTGLMDVHYEGIGRY